MLYPLFLEPIYKSTLWGGRNLERLYKRILPFGAVSESWEIACHGSDSNIISNGEFKGKDLNYIFQNYKSELLGKRFDQIKKFPLLVKIIDANDKLSIQVHPDDEYARINEGDSGKTEMWYIADAKKDAKLVLGLKSEITKADFIAAVQDGTVQNCINYIDVKQGDFLYIPSGTVHAILDGIVIIEIQQSSDITYRIYDWDRIDSSGKSRQLHIEKALDVINFNYKGALSKATEQSCSGYKIKTLITSRFFVTEKIDIEKRFSDSANGDSVFVFTVLEGSGMLKYNDLEYSLNCGQSFLIPAFSEGFDITGSMSLLKTYLP